MAAVTAKMTGGARAKQVLESIGRTAKGDPYVRVGYLESSTYPDGTPVAQVAFWQEFGTPGARFPIPPRPTFRMMIAKHKKEWGPQLGALLKSSGYSSARALASMGERIKDELVDSVLHAGVKPLSAVTLMLRKMRAENPKLRVNLITVYQAIQRVQAGEKGLAGTGAKRLVDTGVMQRAVAYEVRGA